MELRARRATRGEVRHPRAVLLGLLLTGILPFEVNGLYQTALAARPPLFWAVDVATWILVPSIVVATAFRLRLVSWDNLGLGLRIAGRQRPWVLVALLVTVPVALVVSYGLANRLGREWFAGLNPIAPFSYAEVLPPLATGWLRALAILYLAASAGFVEEIYYRGMLMRLFPGGLPGAAAYVLASALLFASGHWEGGGVAVFRGLCFGLLAAILFRTTRSLWPLALGHSLVDALWLL